MAWKRVIVRFYVKLRSVRLKKKSRTLDHIHYLSFSSRPFLDLLLVCWVTFNAELDLLEAPLPQHLLGNVSVLDIAEEPKMNAKMSAKSRRFGWH